MCFYTFLKGSDEMNDALRAKVDVKSFRAMSF